MSLALAPLAAPVAAAPPPCTGSGRAITPARLAPAVPKRIAGVRMHGAGITPTRSPTLVHAAYVLGEGAARRFVNVQISEVVDLDHERAYFRGLNPGVVVPGRHGGEDAGFEVAGFVGERHFEAGKRAEARLLICDTLSVQVSVERSERPSEVLEYLEAVDLARLAKVAPPLAAEPTLAVPAGLEALAAAGKPALVGPGIGHLGGGTFRASRDGWRAGGLHCSRSEYRARHRLPESRCRRRPRARRR